MSTAEALEKIDNAGCQVAITTTGEIQKFKTGLLFFAVISTGEERELALFYPAILNPKGQIYRPAAIDPSGNELPKTLNELYLRKKGNKEDPNPTRVFVAGHDFGQYSTPDLRRRLESGELIVDVANLAERTKQVNARLSASCGDFSTLE